MCGIAGMYRFGDTPIRGWQLDILAGSLEYRGNDATGFATIDFDGRLDWYKKAEPAWKVVASKDFKEWARRVLPPKNNVRILLVHTRKATKGSPYKADNNHPMVRGGGKTGAIVHNGWINNDDALFASNKDKDAFKRSCETDSDIIRAILDDNNGVNPSTIRDMSQMDGCAAVGGIHPSTPDKLLLLRDGNPLMLASTEDLLYFASDKRAIHNASKPWVLRHKMLQQVHAPDVSFLPMNNKSAYIIGPEGLEFHAEFDCSGRTFRPHAGTPYPSITDYHQRQDRFEAAAKVEKSPGVTVMEMVHAKDTPDTPDTPESTNLPVKLLNPPPDSRPVPKFVMCPNTPDCTNVVDLEESGLEDVPLHLLACKVCATPLARAITISQVN